MSTIMRLSRNVSQVLMQNGRVQVAARMCTGDIDRGYKPDKFEKWILKRYGKKRYPTVDDVPNIVQSAEMDLAKSKARVQLSVIITIAVLVTALALSVDGRRKRKERLRLLEDGEV